MPSSVSHRIVARVLGRDAAQRATIPQGGTDEDIYLLARRDRAVAEGWTAEANRCFFCGQRAWRTGYLPTIEHPMAYCKKHLESYCLVRNRKPDAAHIAEKNRSLLRTHMLGRGRLETTLCGIEPANGEAKTTSQWLLVDCERCLALRKKDKAK